MRQISSEKKLGKSEIEVVFFFLHFLFVSNVFVALVVVFLCFFGVFLMFLLLWSFFFQGFSSAA